MAEPTTGMPRWVKVSVIVGAVLIVVVIAVLLISGGEHGPSRHMWSGQHAPLVDVLR